MAVAGLLLAAGAVHAADLDWIYHHHHHHPRHMAARRFLGYVPPPPTCRRVPDPQMDLYNEVTRFGETSVCLSRGVYTDSFWPGRPPF